MKWNSGLSLYLQLTLFSFFAGKADKLAPGGNTLANESFNKSVASKAPKARHINGSESLSYRVNAATWQKNIGDGDVSMV